MRGLNQDDRVLEVSAIHGERAAVYLVWNGDIADHSAARMDGGNTVPEVRLRAGDAGAGPFMMMSRACRPRERCSPRQLVDPR